MADDKKNTFNADDLKMVLRQRERTQLKAELQLLEKRQKKGPAKLRKLYYTIGALAAAAAIALLIIFVGLPRFAPSPGDLFAQYFEPTPNILDPTERGQEITTIDTSSEQTELAFGSGSPTSTAKAEQALIADFYAANDKLSEGQAAEAIPLLTPLAGQDSDFGQAASWYLALAYLKTLDLEQAKVLFAEMAKDAQHPYQKESTQILQILMGG